MYVRMFIIDKSMSHWYYTVLYVQCTNVYWLDRLNAALLLHYVLLCSMDKLH